MNTTTRRTLGERYRMLIEALDGTPRDLVRLTRPVDDAAALVRPGPGEWCIKDVVAHLADIEPQFRAHLIRILEQENPVEPDLHPNPAAHDLARPLPELIRAFRVERDRTVDLLTHLSHSQWLRPCTHPLRGPSKLRKQVEILIGHDNNHLAQIVSIRQCIAREM